MKIVQIDPDVELLADVPILGPEEDLFDRVLLASRVAELATAGPPTAPRLVALTGDSGAGKSSVLALVSAVIGELGGLAMVAFDAALIASAQAVMTTLNGELMRLFEALGVLEVKDKFRNTLSSYGGMVSSIARIAGVKVDVAGALERSAESLRTEIAQSLEQAGKRLVIVIDHLDRLPPTELGGALAALRMYAAIPYVAIVIAVDRRACAVRHAPGADPTAFERLVQVEIAVPPPDRLLLARVLAGGLLRTATRIHRDLDALLPLFDPDGGIALELIETPRDAKRVVNALAAALPLTPQDELVPACLEIALRVLVPEIDSVRLESRKRSADRPRLYEQLAKRLAGHRRAVAARVALHMLILGEPIVEA
ncbi:MAG: AAA family ATPase [Deltaproteobacteria bacterium]|nr:AAA family ATPase [Deltaproteobacteria bacterium]